MKESEKKVARVETKEGEKNKWVATLTILVSHPYTLFFTVKHCQDSGQMFTFLSPSALSLCVVLHFVFQNPSKADSGDYKCSVKNKWGNDHTTFNMG